MLVLEDLTAEIPDTNAFHWNLKKFSREDGTKRALFYGYNSLINPDLWKETRGYKRALFNNWAPCEFAQEFTHPGKRPMDYEDGMDVVFSICPYTVEFMNQNTGKNKYRDIFYPYCSSLVPGPTEKKYDVIYHGGIHGIEHSRCLKAMAKFNYRYCSMTHGINQTTYQHLPYATNLNLSFRDKINLIAESKISICYNLVHVMPDQVGRIMGIKASYADRFIPAFKTVGEGWDVMPQFKTRMHEAAFSKTLNLIRRDEWNVAERYYEPETEFVYFDDEKDLAVKIQDILRNWDSYQPVIERAYEKSKLYTTDKFMEKIEAEL